MISIGSTFKGICTRFGNRVDTATDEVGLADIERSDYDLNLFDSIHRDRITTAGQTVIQAEVVVEVRTIHRKVCRTSVATGKTHAVRIRRDTCQILDATVDSRDAVHLLVRDVQGRTGLFRHEACTLSGNNYFIQFFRRFFQIHIQVVGFTQLQSHLFEDCRLIANVRNGNLIRTAGTHTLKVETTIHVGNGSIVRTRRRMHCHDGSADYRLSV